MLFGKLYRWVHRWMPGYNYRQKIMLAILLFTLLPFFAGGIYFLSVYTHTKQEKQLEQIRSDLGYATNHLSLVTYVSLQKMLYIKSNLNVLLFLRQDYSADLVQYMTNMSGVSSIVEGMKSDRVNNKIFLYGSNESLYRNDYVDHLDKLDPDVLDKVKKLAETDSVWVTRIDRHSGEIKIDVYSKIMDVNDLVGVLDLQINPELIRSSLAYDLPDRSLLVFMTAGNDYTVISSKGISAGKPDEMVSAYIRERNMPGYRVVSQPLKDIGDRAVLFVSKDDLNKQNTQIVAAGGLAIFVLLFTIYFSVRQVSILLTRRLTLLMKRVSMEVGASADAPGEFVPLAPKSQDEFETLARKFNELIVVVREHYRSESQHELDQKLLELKLLQISINPHFLYNTLSAIKWTYPDAKLQQLVDAMVKYYRIFLNQGEPLIPIMKEIELLTVYMDIQKFAYDSNFEYAVDIQEELKNKSILRNLLQPIVENAILHGINGLESGGKITIRGRIVGDRVVFLIADNGVGISKSKREFTTGYGLENVVNRLRLYDGDSSRLQIRSRPGIGTVVRLKYNLR